MASNRLREALVLKTSWSRQQLSAQVQKVRAHAPMTTATAQAVLAHQRGIQIAKYLDDDELRIVRDVLSKLSAIAHGNGANGAAHEKASSSKQRASRQRTMVFPSRFKLSDPLLSEAKIQEAREMAAIYPLLYVLENSMRELVQRVMRSKYGADWWGTALTSGAVKTLKQNSDVRREKESQTSWHQRRGAHPIDYIDLRQLGELILAKQDHFFPDVLGNNRQWLEQFMRELEPSRNVVCHMNPLSEINIKDLEVRAARWRQLLEDRKDRIPSA